MQEETNPVFRQRIKGFLPALVLVKPGRSVSSITVVTRPLDDYVPPKSIPDDPSKSKTGSILMDAMKAAEDAKKSKKP